MVSRKQTGLADKGKKKKDQNGMTTDINNVVGEDKSAKSQSNTSQAAVNQGDKRSKQQSSRHDQSSRDGEESKEVASYPGTRSSTRVTKRPRRDLSPPASPPRKQTKESKVDGKSATPETKTRRPWELWSAEDKNLFFEGLYEFGKDFDAIQNLIVQRHKKKGDPDCIIKNKDQVRHFFYRTWHKISKYIDHTEGVNKQTQELYGLINYWELRKKVGGRLDDKSGQKLNELIHKGATTIKVRGKNHRLKTPQCRALKRLNNVDGPKEEEQTRLPDRVIVELQPRNNEAWARVQSMAHNPRVRMHLKHHHLLSDVIEFLQKKWKPLRLKQKEEMKVYDEKPQELKLHLPDNEAVNTYSVKSVSGQQKRDLGLQNLKENMKANISPPGKKGSKNESKKNAKESASCSKVTTEGSTVTGMGAFSAIFNKPSEEKTESDKNSSSHTVDSNTGVKISEIGAVCESAKVDATKETQGKSSPMESTSVISKNEDSNVKNVLDPSLPEGGENQVIRQQIRDGWTLKNASKVTMAELYLTLGNPAKVVLEYEWCEVVQTADILKVNLANMLRRLVHLANTEFTDVGKSRQVILTSPTRCNCGAVIQNGTPPSNKQTVGRHANRSPHTPKGGDKPGGATTPKSRANQATNAAGKKVGRRLSSASASSNEDNEKDINAPTAVKPAEESVFRIPTVPPIATRGIATRFVHDTSQKDFMQQLSSLQGSDRLLPKKSTKKLNRKPMVVQRTLLPKTQVPARHMVALAMLPNTSQVSQTASFMPVSTGQSLVHQGGTTIVGSPVNPGHLQYRRVVQVPLAVTSASVIKPAPVRIPTVTTTATFSSAGTSLLTQTPLASSSPLIKQTKPASSTPSILEQAVNSIALTASDVAVISAADTSNNSVLSVSLLNDVSLSDLPNPPGPNISSLLELSMNGPEDSTDKLIDLALCNSNNSLSGFLDQSMGHKAGSSGTTRDLSPPNPEMQWLGGEDFSLSNFLAESPVKKAGSNSVLMSVPVVPPPNILAESSRDSLIGKYDVDTQLQCMMNESSMDYASKFADLAAQLAAGPETPHKPDAMVTQDKQQ